MPQNSRHPSYLFYQPQWQRCHDAMAGTDAVKGAGEVYLPRPSGMAPRDYQAYKARPAWFGASARVQQGLKGLIFREPPEITIPARLAEDIKDVTRTGIGLETFSDHAVGQHLETGRIGILIDLPQEEQTANLVRPQWRLYRAGQIINWWQGRTATGGVGYVRVVLEEEVDSLDPVYPHDTYRHADLLQWRELVIEDGVYIVRLWRRPSGSSTEFVLVDEHVPLRRGTPLDFLPFDVQNADTSDAILSPPPLLDVVDINLSHYRTSADYEHELHMTSLSTLWITGWDYTEKDISVGGLTALIIPEAEARVGYAEVTGHGLQAKLDKLKADEARMAVLGARLLEPQQRIVEAAETHQLRQNAETSIMEAYADAVSGLLTKALRWHAWWAGVTEKQNDETISLTLNTDFLPTKVDAQTLTALVSAWQAGALTQEDLYENLRQGSLLAPGVLFEEWQAKLAEQGALALLAGPLAGMNAQNGPGEPIGGVRSHGNDRTASQRP